MQHAEDCAERGRREPDPLLRCDFFDMELRWLKLGRSYQFVDQLSAFTTYNAQQHGMLSERLQGLRARMDEIGANRPAKS
jgi:hypothetical protein